MNKDPLRYDFGNHLHGRIPVLNRPVDPNWYKNFKQLSRVADKAFKVFRGIK